MKTTIVAVFLITINTLLWKEVSCECSSGVYATGVSRDEQESIVRYHNDFRSQVANGNVSGQPRAINMKRLYWDSYLAGQAQNIANTCILEHVKVSDERFAVGQNLYAEWPIRYDTKANWKGAVQYWFDENKVYKYPNGFSLETGHYTQVVWADTSYVGCGFTFFPNKDKKYQKLYVCNYGPAGNYPGPPYKTGNSGCENLC